MLQAHKAWKSFLEKGGSFVLGGLFTLITWYGLSSSLSQERQWLLPPPDRVFSFIIRNYNDLWTGIMSTGFSSLLGFAAGALAGFILAVIFHLVPLAERAILPFVSTLPAIPIISIAPLIVLWIGFGMPSKIFIVAFISFFPILVTVLTGLTRGYSAQREYLMMQGALLRARFLYLDLPASLSYFAAGIKTSAPLAVIGAIVAEYVAPKDGLGYLVLTYALRTDITGTIAAAVTCALLGLLFSSIVTILGNLLQKKFPGE